MSDVIIYLPERSDDLISASLRTLTEHIAKNTKSDVSSGLLGGEYGYGAWFENDVFMMHPFCWCERMDCAWCRSCECDYDWKTDVTLSECAACKGELPRSEPHFRFKPSGAEARWYKYIGRSMDIEGAWPADWLAQCMKSVSDAPAT